MFGNCKSRQMIYLGIQLPFCLYFCLIMRVCLSVCSNKNICEMSGLPMIGSAQHNTDYPHPIRRNTQNMYFYCLLFINCTEKYTYHVHRRPTKSGSHHPVI